MKFKFLSLLIASGLVGLACKAEIPVGGDIKLGRDELVHYYHAQAVFNLDNTNSTGYRAAMFDHLQSQQNKDGSWPAADGIGVGPIYSTAVWCIVLQVDKKGHPSRQPELQFRL